jgi:uncharacterized protein YgiB involved in biofilm formation
VNDTKRSDRVRLLVGIGASAALLGVYVWERRDTRVAADMFEGRSQCIASGRYSEAQCEQAYQTAKFLSDRQAPRYFSRADCAAEFPAETCQPVAASPGVSAPDLFAPAMTAFLISRYFADPQPVYRSCPDVSGQPDCRSSSSGGGYSGRSYYTKDGYRISYDHDNGVRVAREAFGGRGGTAPTLTRGGFGGRAITVAS